MKPGIYYSMPEAEYRAAPGISQSSLKPIARSPAHFRAGVDDEDGREDTRALLLGRIVSTLVLEPDRQPWWAIKPDTIKLNETEGKDWAKEFLAWDESKDGKFPRSAKEAFEKKCVQLVPFDDFETACRMATVLADSKKPEVRNMLDGAKREVSVFADAETAFGNVLCKCRPDIVCGGNVLSDLKTCLDARPDAFLKSVRKYGYHIQAASYCKHWNAVCGVGDEKEVFLFLAVEKSAPYAHTVHRLSGAFMEQGRQEYEDMLEVFARCQASHDWPDYPEGISELELPERYRNRID